MMKRTPLHRKTALRRGESRLQRKKRIKAKRRDASEFRRIYGSRARVAAIAALPCAVPDCDRRPCENHHVRTGGIGRKAGWEMVANLCGYHHRRFHELGYYTFSNRYGVDLVEVAGRLAREVKP